MTFVDDKVNALNETDRANFRQTLSAVLGDDLWLSLRGFADNYSPDMVRLTLYREMYERDFSRLH